MKKKKSDFKLDVLTQKRTMKQYPKFFICGVLGAIINLIILYVLTEYFGIYYLISALIAFIVSSSLNFVLNKTWTFKEDIEDEFFQKYLKFGAVRFIVLGISIGFLFVLTEYFRIYYIISQTIALAIVGVISFVAHKVWVFEKYRLGKK
jgi:dolichol-phosphate mannosyltransferase